MELTTGKLKTKPLRIQEKSDHGLIQRAILHLYREKPMAHIYRKKASIPIEWKK